MSSRPRGFTQIELIAVVVILGILAALAVPKFLSLRSEAYRAKLGATAAAFRAAANSVNVLVRIRGLAGAQDNVQGFGGNNLETNAAGYPVDTNGTNTIGSSAACARLWNGLLANPPTVGTAAGGSEEYLAQRVTVSGSNQHCRYTLRADSSRNITYSAVTGAVTEVNP